MKLTIHIFFIMTLSMIFSPISGSKSPSTQSSLSVNSTLFPASMSLQSINQQNIEKIYGAQGLNLSKDTVVHIQQTYSYIETVIKSTKIHNNPTLQASFSKYYTSGKSSPFVSQDILASKEWKALAFTSQDIHDSELWQLYLKSMVVDYYDNQSEFVESISMVENQIFPYLANIELNFYNNECIKLRQFAEKLRVEKKLQDVVLQRNLQQINGWSNKDQKSLVASLAAFKATDFYKYTHNQNAWSKSMKTIDIKLRSYVMSYFMLITVQSDVQKELNQNNLLPFLTQASYKIVSPNFFNYQPDDSVYFDTIFWLQQASNNSPKGAGKVQERTTFDLKDLVDTSKVLNSKNSENVKI